GHPARLVSVVLLGLAGVDLAEVAAAGALVAADEERRLAVLPAFVDVGAARLFTDRVQALAAHERFQLGVFGARLQLGLDPRGLALDRGFGVAHLQAEELSAFRSNGHTASLRLPPRWPLRGRIS